MRAPSTARATRTASAVARTSCTRTAHAPACAARAETAAVHDPYADLTTSMLGLGTLGIVAL
ncbi:hypothetical protein ACWCRI_21205, partial [Streptomyces collinus]